MYKKMIAVLPVLVVLLAISGFHTPAVASEPPVRDVPPKRVAPYWEEAASYADNVRIRTNEALRPTPLARE